MLVTVGNFRHCTTYKESNNGAINANFKASRSFGGDKMMTLEDNMSQMTDGGLTGELAQQVAPKLIMDLQQGLPPGVQAAAPETITEAVTQ